MSEWHLSTSPEEYLDRYGADAKNSDLARQVISERDGEEPDGPGREPGPSPEEGDEDHSDQIAELRADLEELRERLAADEVQASGEVEKRDAKWRSHHLESLSRDIRQLELRHKQTRDGKVARGIEVARKALGRLPGLAAGESMWEGDEHDVFHQFADQRR